jgi:hypothetical protein
MADADGDYVNGFTLLALLALSGAFCFIAATPPKRSV